MGPGFCAVCHLAFVCLFGSNTRLDVWYVDEDKQDSNSDPSDGTDIKDLRNSKPLSGPFQVTA